MTFIFLSKKFYDDYATCPEIEKKRTRPYVQVLVKVNDVVFAVPLRSHINHKYVLWTDQPSRCGLDFSKTVVLSDSDYIDTSKIPFIRPLEFDALRGKEYLIRQHLQQYINIYKKARKRMDVPRNRIICQFSTLQYFEEYI